MIFPLPGDLQSQGFHVRVHHNCHKVGEVYPWLPLQLFLRFRRIGQQSMDFKRPEITIRDLDVLFPVQPRIREGFFYKFTY